MHETELAAGRRGRNLRRTHIFNGTVTLQLPDAGLGTSFARGKVHISCQFSQHLFEVHVLLQLPEGMHRIAGMGKSCG